VYTPAQAIDVIHGLFGRHDGHRALHAKGTWCSGTFTATPQAAELSRAAHLSGDPVPVTARLSNGAGHPGVRDHDPDVRGLAVSFRLPDGSRTDLLAQSVPRFQFSTPDEFLDFLRAASGRSAVWKLPAYLAAHPRTIPAMPANAAALRPPPSYAQCRFFTVHSYRWIAADGSARYVRCDWVPEAGDKRLSLLKARRLGRDYLQEELAARLAREPVRFMLEARIAEDGDDVHDPASSWPAERRRIDAGTLELTTIGPDPEEDGVFVFDPVRVTDGVEPSEDPILLFRPKAYSESVERRA
jgi:catalase